MTFRVSAYGTVPLATAMLGGTLFLDIDGDQLNLLPTMRTIVLGESRFSRQLLFVDSTKTLSGSAGSTNTHGHMEIRVFALLKRNGDLTAGRVMRKLAVQ